MNSVKQLYRYAGGKGKLLTRYADVFRGLHPQHCVDYFGGSGTMSLWFHHLYPDATLYLNEIDPAIYGLFTCIQEQYERFCDEIVDLQNTTAHWKEIEGKKRFYYALRDEYNREFIVLVGEDGHELRFENEEDSELLHELGYIDIGPLGYDVFQHACYLLLRKLSFSGINQRNAKGEYISAPGITRRNAPYTAPETLHAFKEMLDHTTLFNTDYRELDFHRSLPRSLHYFDPPYYHASKNLYPSYFDWDKTVELCAYIQRLAEHSTVFMSNYDHPQLHTLMKGFNWYVFPPVGTMKGKKKKDPRREILFYKIHPSIRA